MKHIFYVHTFRCKHGSDESDDYIRTALFLGAEKITFTDHCPFPGNPSCNYFIRRKLLPIVKKCPHSGDHKVLLF